VLLELFGVLLGSLSRASRSATRVRQALHLRPERPDQGVLLGLAQMVEIGKLRHAFVWSRPGRGRVRGFFSAGQAVDQTNLRDTAQLGLSRYGNLIAPTRSKNAKAKLPS
jgi:hypothetical protein